MKSVMVLGAAGAISIVASLAPGASHAQVAAAGGTSAACFDEGLYAKGAVVDFDTKITGDGATGPYRTVTTAMAPGKFNGVSATPVETETFDAKGKSQGVITGYFNFAPGFLLLLGSKGKNFGSTFDPAGREPTEQNEGDTYKQKYKITTTSKPGGSQTVSRQASWTFVGIEQLKSKVGTFKVCKITAKFVDALGPFSTVTNVTTYIAAEGRYRGFALRTKTTGSLPGGGSINTTADVTKFRKFAPK